MARVKLQGCVYRPSTGRGTKARYYWAKYYGANAPKPHVLTLPDGQRITDKTVAQQVLRDRLVYLEERAAGLVRPELESAYMPIRKVVAGYIRHLRANRTLSVQGKPISVRRPNVTIRKVLRRLQWILRLSGERKSEGAVVTRLGELNARAVNAELATLAQRGLAEKTRNHYRDAIVGLGAWAASDMAGLLTVNPLQGLPRIRRPAKTAKRRALSVEEARRLVTVAPNRALWYQFAMLTGLRVSEIAAVTWGDVHLDGDRPAVDVRIETTKAKREAEQPLSRFLAARLAAARPADAGDDDPVFVTTPSRGSFVRDCTAAGIQCHPDRNGEKVDRHALRTTFASWLGTLNISPRMHTLLTRHSPRGITESEYQDFRLVASDAWAVVRQLPELRPVPQAERMQATGTHDLRPVVPSVAPKGGADWVSVGADRRSVPTAATRKSRACRELGANCAATGDWEKMEAGGIEQSAHPLKPHS